MGQPEDAGWRDHLATIGRSSVSVVPVHNRQHRQGGSAVKRGQPRSQWHARGRQRPARTAQAAPRAGSPCASRTRPTIARMVPWPTPYPAERSRRLSYRARSAMIGQAGGAIRGVCCGNHSFRIDRGATAGGTATGAGGRHPERKSGKYAGTTTTPGDMLSTGRIELAEVTGSPPHVKFSRRPRFRPHGAPIRASGHARPVPRAPGSPPRTGPRSSPAPRARGCARSPPTSATGSGDRHALAPAHPGQDPCGARLAPAAHAGRGGDAARGEPGDDLAQHPPSATAGRGTGRVSQGYPLLSHPSQGVPPVPRGGDAARPPPRRPARPRPGEHRRRPPSPRRRRPPGAPPPRPPPAATLTPPWGSGLTGS